MREKCPRHVVVDVESKYYACLFCKRLIARSAYYVDRHIGTLKHCGVHKNRQFEADSSDNETEDFSINLTLSEIALKDFPTISMSNIDRTNQTSSGYCKLCEARFKIKLNRDSDIKQHVSCKKHKRLSDLKITNPNAANRQILLLYQRSKLEDLITKYDCESFILLKDEADSGGVHFHCTYCDKKIQDNQAALRWHLKSRKHNDQVPHPDGFRNKDFFYDIVECFICSKYL